ncbi:MAG: adenylate/guanylate cyclase domain-containing protein, partial [bacterium]
MKSYSALKVRNTKFTPPKPIAQYPKDSIQKLAVLFTDIVGSSNYFKSYGDIAGRNMLRMHQEMTSGPINEHGGVLVKLLGDSVMSYFFDAKEALKSAIRIQQAFFSHNQQNEVKDQIHIRIGIHFGEGIIEAKEAVDRLQKLLGNDGKKVLEAQPLLIKIEELLSTDSYFGYIDVIHYNHTIANMSRRLVEGR